MISRWKSGRDVAANIIQVQGLETFVQNEWKRDKMKTEISGASSTGESMDNDHPLKTENATDKSYAVKLNTSVYKRTPKNLNRKYGPVNKKFVKSTLLMFLVYVTLMRL